MSIVHVINPMNDINSVRSTLSFLSGSKGTDSEKVIFRVPDVGRDVLRIEDIMIRPVTTRRDYDDDPDSSGDYSSKNVDSREAIVEILKSLTDIDISLSTGYIAFEVPNGATDPGVVDTHCFLTIEDLHHYLKAVNAVSHQNKDSIPWRGFELSVDQSVQSSMVFESIFRCIELKKEDAIAYLNSLGPTLASISSGPSTSSIQPKIISETGRMKTKIYVVPNIPCTISIIKDNEFFTGPVSKQRLLYLYDVIHDWLEKFKKRWITLSFNVKSIKPGDENVTFRYKFDTMVRGWNDLPKLTIDTMSMIKDVSVHETSLWKPFTTLPVSTSVPTVSIQERLDTMIEFLGNYGIDMSERDFTGSFEDYVPDRRNFQLPVRQIVAKVTAVQPRNSRDRSMSPLRDRSENRGHGRGRGHNTRSMFPSEDEPFIGSRGRPLILRGSGDRIESSYQGRGRGRGRSGNHGSRLDQGTDRYGRGSSGGRGAGSNRRGRVMEE